MVGAPKLVAHVAESRIGRRERHAVLNTLSGDKAAPLQAAPDERLGHRIVAAVPSRVLERSKGQRRVDGHVRSRRRHQFVHHQPLFPMRPVAAARRGGLILELSSFEGVAPKDVLDHRVHLRSHKARHGDASLRSHRNGVVRGHSNIAHRSVRALVRGRCGHSAVCISCSARCPVLVSEERP
eukprot:1829365-Prymnesium_polylepis.2